MCDWSDEAKEKLKLEIEILKKLIFNTKRLNLALDMLIKIRNSYPHVYSECISDEEHEKLVEKYND